ncbi:hypothetical protein [Streptomyces sp. R41]|uniref:Uncharacterized protein n=1 Tax=Streptomyces sp. R41 TaxID=3238632 RepID=A0AB39R948_9ACTN
MRDYVAALPAPRDRNKTLTVSVEPVTAPHDCGVLFPDGSGSRKSGHATAYCPLPPADMAGIVSLYGLRGWTEQDDKPVKHELVLADFQLRSGQAIQREPPVVSDPFCAAPNSPAWLSPWSRASGSASPCHPNQQSGRASSAKTTPEGNSGDKAGNEAERAAHTRLDGQGW